MHLQKYGFILLAAALSCSGLSALGGAAVNIGSPSEGQVLRTRSAVVTGTASATDLDWTETTRADFEDGTKVNVQVDAAGSISLPARSVYDDFKDGTIDTSKWTLSVDSGFTMTEENGALRTRGTPTSGTWSNADAVTPDTVSNDVAATMVTFSGGTYGYGSGIYLRQDSQYSVGIYLHYDWTWGYKRLAINYQVAGYNTEVLLSDVSSNPTPRNFRLVYDQGSVYYYTNEVLVYTKAGITLSNPILMMHSATESYRTSIDTSWNNVTVPCTSGSYVSSPYDTGCAAPVLRKVDWSASVPSQAGIVVEVRSSNSQDMASATPWKAVSDGQGSGLPTVRRYLQYRVAMTNAAESDGPVFRDITIGFCRPVAKVEVSVDAGISWILATGTTSWSTTLELPESAVKIMARATDAAGGATEASVSVEVDTTAPAGSVRVNYGDEFTVSREVSLEIRATDHYGIESMMLSELPDFPDTDWVKYASYVPFMLSEGDGSKNVFAKFRDVHGWESEVENDSIILHTTPPAGSVVVDGGAEFTDTTSVTLGLDATDIAGISEMIVSNRADFQDATWRLFQRALPWELLPGNGERTVYAAFRNTLNQVSPTVLDTILLDTVAPALRLSINDGAPYSRSAGVVLQLDASDNYRVADMQVANLPDFSGGAWVSFAPSMGWELLPIDGNGTVYARVRDAAGNVGPVTSASIILDTAAPSASVLPLPATVDDWNFTVNWTGSDATSGVLSFDVQSRDGDGPWTDWILNTNRSGGKFTGLDGHAYSFRARAQDRAGNLGTYPEAGSSPVRVSIPGPTVLLLLPAENAIIKGKYTVTGSASHPKAALKVVAVEVQVDGGAWQRANSTSNWSFLLDTARMPDGRHAIRARAFDGAKYSQEVQRGFVVRNYRLQVTTETFPPVLVVALLVTILCAAAGYLAYRGGWMDRSRAPAPRAIPPESLSPPPTTPLPVAFAVKAPRPQVNVVKISVKDIEEEPGPAAPMEEKVPPIERSPEEIAERKAQDSISERESKVLQALSSLPRGLPSSLWGIELEDLAAKVVAAERRDSPEGDTLVKIVNRWYYGDETNLGLFMQHYKDR